MEDELLNQLALEAKHLTLAARQDPSRNLERQRVLNRLLSQILDSKRLVRPQQGQWNTQLYDDLWNEARSRTILEIAKRIEKYQPEYAILAWVNKTLSFRFKDVVRDYYGSGMTGISRQNASLGIGKIQSLDALSDKARIRSLDELDQYQPAELNESDLLRQFILDDPEQKLNKMIRGRPKATFRFLLLAILEAQSWDEISAILGPPLIPKSTLSTFFNRQLHKLEDYFRKYLGE